MNGLVKVGSVSVVLFLLSLGQNATADVYKWSDRQNNVVYSDRPPRQVRSVELPSGVGNALGSVPKALPDRQSDRVTKVKSPDAPVNYLDWKSTPNVKFYEGARVKSRPRSKQATQRVAKKRSPCARYRKQLALIQNQLRAGYSEPKGNKLRARRRALGNRLSYECR
ncbi:MAG: hypothetical protein COB04_13475 [Gammaproteobacteria bacterium]|nr:MAG: hypothetical protein COB04_13475 [Gammaproteobacteria bacterium]